MMNKIKLLGCRPEPLLSYLKALGVFRLVSEQVDRDARAAWEDDVFVLHTSLTQDELLQFFINTYRPTPIVVPWSGDDFFKIEDTKLVLPVTITPAGASVIAAVMKTTTSRFELYRQTIRAIVKTMKYLKIQRVKPDKDKDGKDKAPQLSIPGKKLNASQCKNLLTSNLRDWLPDEAVNWMDTALALDSGGDKPSFNSLLGSGGGSDGNSHFSDNFMQNLWDVLPDFDVQRKTKPDGNPYGRLEASLFDIRSKGLFAGRTSALFDSGAVGGPNASQDMERESLTNPWNFILGLEGALCMAGAASRRMNATRSGSAFPFMVSSRAVGNGVFAPDKESGQKEIWLPQWSRAVNLGELNLIFSEGRAELHRKSVRDGVDFARAVSSYGIDRGIDSFVRYALIKGRVGGENYNTAVALGRIAVQAKPNVDLLTEIDGWLNAARRNCDGKEAPVRFRTAYRQLENAIFDYCRYGDAPRFANVLMGLGGLERELSRGPSKPGQVGNSEFIVSPVPSLSLNWIHASDDGTPEWRIAMALASIQGISDKFGALRVHFESLSPNQRKWADVSKTVVWTSTDLLRNMTAVLERRMLEWQRMGLNVLPLVAKRYALPADIAAFLGGTLDFVRLEALLWGALLINWNDAQSFHPQVSYDDVYMLPRTYDLLKLLFIPDLNLKTAKGQPLLPDAEILAALRADNTNRACDLAGRRLRVSGYTPKFDAQTLSGSSATALAAALLIPVALPKTQANSLPLIAQLVLRQPQSNLE